MNLIVSQYVFGIVSGLCLVWALPIEKFEYVMDEFWRVLVEPKIYYRRTTKENFYKESLENLYKDIHK